MALTRTTTPTQGAEIPRYGRWLLPVILLGNVLNVVDIFVVNVALPSLSRTLHAGPAALELVVAGYSVAYACLLVTGGRLGDTFGRRRLFLAGMAGFTATSAICGLAPTAGVLIVARMLQGATAAFMVPQVLATIQVVYQGAARQRALAIFGAVMAGAAGIGQILSGALVSADIFGLEWRPAFLINVPVGIAGLIAARRVLPETRAANAAPIDMPGTVLLGAAVLMLLVPLTIGREEHWPLWCYLLLAAAPMVAAAFAITQRRAERRGGLPLLPPSLLRTPGMRRGLLVALIYFPLFGGMMLTTTVSLQYGLHLSPIGAGFALTPYAVAFLFSSLLTRRLVTRYGRNVVVAGALLQSSALAIIAVQAATGYEGMSALAFAPGLILFGLGQATTVVPLVAFILNGVPADRAGVASGAFTTTQQIAMATGVAAIGTLFFAVADTHGFGPATATAAAIEAALALLTALLARTLPSTR